MDGMTYFTFQKEMNLPIYIRYLSDSFSESLEGFLMSLGFSKMTDEEAKSAMGTLEVKAGARLLTISEASVAVARQIESSLESDKFGNESVMPKHGYKVYRMRKRALLIYSLAAPEWQLGTYQDFGSKETEVESRIVIGRFLGWSLGSLGLVGFWGTPVEDGAVIMRPQKANGEFIVVDALDRQLITFDGISKMKPLFKMKRLDPILKDRTRTMSKEQYISFLLANTCYFDYSGPTVAIRQLVQFFAKNSDGVIQPEVNFRPRTSL